MRTTVRALAFFLGLLVAGAAALAQDRNDAARELLQISGAWDQLAELAVQTSRGVGDAVRAQNPKLTEAELARMKQAMEAAVEAPQLQHVATRVLAEGLDLQHLSAWRQWFASDTGRHATRLETQAMKDDRDGEVLMRLGTDLLAQSSDTRRRLLDELLQASKAVDAAVTIVIGTATAMACGVMVAQLQPCNPDVVRDTLLQDQRAQMTQLLAPFIGASNAVHYQAMSEDDLQRYIAFYRSPAGAHFQTVLVSAFAAALADAGDRLGHVMVQPTAATKP